MAACYPNKLLMNRELTSQQASKQDPNLPQAQALADQTLLWRFFTGLPSSGNMAPCTSTASQPYLGSALTSRRANAPPCKTAASTMPFSTDLLLTSLSAEPYPGRTGQRGAAPAVHTCIPHFTPTPWLFRSCSSSSPSKSTTSSSFHRPQLLPHVCCSLKDAKQAEDVQASSQRHCSNVSFLYSSSYCSHTHTFKLSSTSS